MNTVPFISRPGRSGIEIFAFGTKLISINVSMAYTD